MEVISEYAMITGGVSDQGSKIEIEIEIKDKE